MNQLHRKSLAGTNLDYFDTEAAVNAIKPGAYATLPYTSRVLAENLVRRCDPQLLTASLEQIVFRKQDLDFPWFPARVVCHDIRTNCISRLGWLKRCHCGQGRRPV